MSAPEKTNGGGAPISESAPAPGIEGAPVDGAPETPLAEEAPAPERQEQASAAEEQQDAPAAEEQQAAAAGAEHQAEPPAHDSEEHQNLQRDLEELTAKASKADEYLELAQRTKADFENYRKRAAREAATAQERGVAKLAKELLPAVDNLDRALAAAEAAGVENGDETLASGIKLVHADVIAALARAGVERYSPEGEVFDPQHHEAVAQQPIDGAQPGTIVEVYQRGYRLGDAVIRPARVLVAG